MSEHAEQTRARHRREANETVEETVSSSPAPSTPSSAELVDQACCLVDQIDELIDGDSDGEVFEAEEAEPLTAEEEQAQREHHEAWTEWYKHPVGSDEEARAARKLNIIEAKYAHLNLDFRGTCVC